MLVRELLNRTDQLPNSLKKVLLLVFIDGWIINFVDMCDVADSHSHIQARGHLTGESSEDVDILGRRG